MYRNAASGSLSLKLLKIVLLELLKCDIMLDFSKSHHIATIQLVTFKGLNFKLR